MRIRQRAVIQVLSILIIAGVVAIAGGSSSASAKPGARVINGAPVDATTYASRWSSIAALVASGEADARNAQFCGGTFIAPTVVATAAHCVVDADSEILLIEGTRTKKFNQRQTVKPTAMSVLGGRRVLSIRNGQRFEVEHISIHPQYDIGSNQFDAALIKLKSSPTAASGITPISPVQPGEDAIWGAGGGVASSPANGPWVAGWGYRTLPNQSSLFSGQQHTPINRPTKPTLPKGVTSRSSRSIANGLEQATVPIVSDSACDTGAPGQGVGYGREFDAVTMLCAGTLDSTDSNDLNATTNGVDTCYGDSGGPMVAMSGTNLRLIGMTSFGSGCATRDTFGVYTRVAAVRDFIAAEPRKPVVRVKPPVAVGGDEIGSVLRCAKGSWTGAAPLRYSYRWVRLPKEDSDAEAIGYFSDADVYERIPGSKATSAYRLRASDRGSRVGCLVFVTGTGSSAAAASKLHRIAGGDDDEDDDNS